MLISRNKFSITQPNSIHTPFMRINRAHTCAGFNIPDLDGIIMRSTHNTDMVCINRPNTLRMPKQSPDGFSSFEIPDFDSIVQRTSHDSQKMFFTLMHRSNQRQSLHCANMTRKSPDGCLTMNVP